MLRFIAPLVGLALVLAGCEEEYMYRPEENATAQLNGVPAARYAIPPEAPQGDVRIASHGMSKIREHAVGNEEGQVDEHGREIRALHVRMSISNTSPQDWSVDGRQQIAEL